jgi:hypothetical protein
MMLFAPLEWLENQRKYTALGQQIRKALRLNRNDRQPE